MTELVTAYFRGRDGVRLAYRELGEGRPLILIHGYLSSARAMAGIAGKIADIELPGDHGTAITTPQFEAAITSFLDGPAAAG